MLCKLAARNVKRQLSNYSVYFITISLTVALMTAINHIVFNEDILSYANNQATMKYLLIGLTVIVAGISALVLSYATSFMLRFRKREFGTYLTLGMTRKNILTMFACETFLLFLVAIILGSIVGYFIYQGLMLMIAYLLEMQMNIASYSGKAFLLTVAMVAIEFLISSLASTVYLKRVSIYDLLHSDKKVFRKVRYPAVWFVIDVFSLALMILSSLMSYKYIMISMLDTDSVMAYVMLWIAVLFLSIGVFIIGLSKSIVNALLKSKRISSRGTAKFTLRQLSEKLTSTSVMAGVIAVLLTASIVFTNIAFGQKTTQTVALNHSCPFDITLQYSGDDKPPFIPEKTEEIINKYAAIKTSFQYKTYTPGNNQITAFTRYGDKTGLNDTVIKESDYNTAMRILGYDEIQLNNSFYIISYVSDITEDNFSDVVIDLNGKEYSMAGFSDEIPRLAICYLFAVLPDEAFDEFTVEASYYTYNLESNKYDVNGLHNVLSEQKEAQRDGNISYANRIYIKEYQKRNENVISANAIIGSIYVSVVFICMALAILALKTLSGISDDKVKYRILFQLGTTVKEQKKTLFLQIFSFFALPFIIPLLVCVPIGAFCAKIISLMGFSQFTGQVFLNCAIIDIIIIVLYFLYFTATYLIAKRNIINE